MTCLAPNGKPLVIHDHFDGSAHCRDCDGPCRLEGADLTVTHLVRSIFESAGAGHYHLSLMVRYALSDLGVPVDHFFRRVRGLI